MTQAESKRPSVVMAGLLAIALVVSCNPSDTSQTARVEPSPTPVPLVPSIRLVGTQFMAGGGFAVEPRAHISIDGVIRPTISGSKKLVFRPDCTETEDDPELVECTLRHPENITTPWSIVETTLPEPEEAEHEAHGARSEHPREQRLRLIARGPGQGEESHTIRLPKEASRFLERRFVEPLEHRSVLTPEMVLPGGGVLRTWIGIEESTWADAPRVVFSVSRINSETVEDRTLLHRQILDPSHNPAHRAWIPVEVRLPDLGVEPLHLLFETLPADKSDLRPSLPVWGDPTIMRAQAEVQRPRRVVLVSLDTLRAKSMSAYGYDRPTTPAFEAMLDEGTLFQNAFTTFTNTLGSHMSMMTGLYPASHRVRASNRTLDTAVPTLAMAMRDAGYETAAFTENALLRADAGFQRGFARYYENKEIFDGAGDAAGTFRRALDWAKTRPTSEPLFLFVHTYEVHAPYVPPEYTENELGELTWEEAAGKTAFDRLDLYEREVVHLDRLLADFLKELQSLAPEGDLLLVITADHGEEFMEHGAIAHLQLYDEVMKIPMFMRWPEHIPGGVRIETPVSLVDLVPTILQLVGGDAPETDGVSLVPLLEGAEISRDAVLGQTASSKFTKGGVAYVARGQDAKCLVNGENGGNIECYDLLADPLEKTPLSPTDDPKFAHLYEHASSYRDLATRDSTDEAEAIDADDEIDPARREKLRLLGYIE